MLVYSWLMAEGCNSKHSKANTKTKMPGPSVAAAQLLMVVFGLTVQLV
jgi:hypothetical protein